MLDEDELLLSDAKPDFIAVNWYVTGVIGQYIGEGRHGEYTGPELPRQSRAKKGVYQYYRNPYTPYSEFNWNCDGTGLRFALRRLYARYHLPIMISENGWAARETMSEDKKIHDDSRIAYIKEMIEAMSCAIDGGVELFAYEPWSFTDVLSSSQGMDKRYGLVFVDRTNDDIKELKRYKKDSFHYYQQVIKEMSNNG